MYTKYQQIVENQYDLKPVNFTSNQNSFGNQIPVTMQRNYASKNIDYTPEEKVQDRLSPMCIPLVEKTSDDIAKSVFLRNSGNYYNSHAENEVTLPSLKTEIARHGMLQERFCTQNLSNECCTIKSKEKKSVGFAAGSKTWDGVRPAQMDFDELLYRFLVQETPVGDKTILRWTNTNYKRILSMCFLVNDLIYRIRVQPPQTSVPCLPKGGGRALRVESVYEPFICSLRSVLLKALTESFVIHGVVFECDKYTDLEKVYAQLLEEVKFTEEVLKSELFDNEETR